MTDTSLAARVYATAHITGTFLLRSGVTSHEYFDKYLFEADPLLLRDIATELAGLVPAGIDALAGLEMGGIPIATMLAQVTEIPARFVRKEAKTYGTCNLAEGGGLEGLQLLIVEDVVTSGGAVIDAVHALRERGAVCEQGVCVIDRESGGIQNLTDIGLTMTPLLTMTQLKAAAHV